MVGGHPAGGATVTCLCTPASSDAPGALGCCCFGTPLAPQPCPCHQRRNAGRRQHPPCPQILGFTHHFSLPACMSGLWLRTVGGFGWWWGCNSKSCFTLMTSWVIRTVPWFGGTVTSPWAGGRDEQNFAKSWWEHRGCGKEHD